MQAITWQGTKDVSVDEVPDPEIEQPTDALIEVTKTAICGSDLHLYNGFAPAMEEGDIIGHEAIGTVVDTGARVDGLQEGDRVVVPFTISCGECWFCEQDMFSLCDNSNPNAEMAREEMGHSPAGIYGYTHLLGGFDGAQAEYLRVPYADVGPTKIEADVSDEQALLLADVFPTGYMAAENADIEEGDTVAVWGLGPVGQFAIQSAWMQGAGRVIGIDRVPERLAMARKDGDAEVVDFSQTDVYDELMDMTNDRGPDGCIDAVGTEAHIDGIVGAADRIKQTVGLEDDRPSVLRQTFMCCRKGGTVSVPGVYLGSVDMLPYGAAMNKSLTIKSGQTHVQRYLDPLMEKIQRGEIDPSFVVTHRAPLADGPDLYETFNDKEDGCVKVVLEP